MDVHRGPDRTLVLVLTPEEVLGINGALRAVVTDEPLDDTDRRAYAHIWQDWPYALAAAMRREPRPSPNAVTPTCEAPK